MYKVINKEVASKVIGGGEWRCVDNNGTEWTSSFRLPANQATCYAVAFNSSGTGKGGRRK